VDNHLQNAYRKLGVTRRQDLPRVLTDARDVASPTTPASPSTDDSGSRRGSWNA
jgi:hypothetical protein